MFGRKKQNLIRIFIKGEPPDTWVKRPIQYDSDGSSRVVMEPTTEKKAGWSFDSTGCVRTDAKGSYVEVFRGARKAIFFDSAKGETKDNKLTLDQAQGLINFEIFKANFGKFKAGLDALKPLIFAAIIIGIVAAALAGYGTYLTNQHTEQIKQIASILGNLAKPTPSPPPLIG